MNLSIVIPNYNGEKLLKKNLPKILDAAKEYKNGKVEIIITDDPSTDKSAEAIAGFIQNITDKDIVGKTISNKNKKESGFAKNVNRGVSVATGDILILLNSDVSPHKDFISPLVAHFDDEKVFAVGCMDESIEKGKSVFRGRGIARWKKGFFIHAKGSIDKDNTLWASGGSSAFRKTYWDKLRGFDILYNPFYWEDIDLSYRALKSGYKVLFEPKSVVVHEHDKGSIRTKYKPSHIKKIAYRNQFIFIWKNITDIKLILSHLFWLPFNFISAIKERDFDFFIGFFNAILRISQIAKSKDRARKLFVISDGQILKNFKQ